jgi:Flp pilus assembly protein TadD
MRALPIAGLLMLAACANGADPGKMSDLPGVGVADAALHSGSPPLAIRIDDAILAKDPRNTAALINRGDAQTASQQFDGAAQSYKTALQTDPKSIQARIGLGRLHLADDPHAAETLFLEALQSDPRNAVALNDLGIARDLLGQHTEAQAAYRQAIGIDASMHGAEVNLALSLAMAGRADDAASMLRPLASAPSASRKMRDNMAAVLAMSGDRNGAQRILSQSLPPDQVEQAIAIFTAASAPSASTPSASITSGPTHLADAAPDPSAMQASAPAASTPVANSPAASSPDSGALASAAPAGAAPLNVASASVAPVSAAALDPTPLNLPPHSAARANVVPVSVASTGASLVTDSPATATPSSATAADVVPVRIVSVSATPADAPRVNAVPLGVASVSAPVANAASPVAVPANAAAAGGAPASSAPVNAAQAGADPASPPLAAGTTMVQLSSTLSREAATGDWHRLQHHLPDLLAARQPAFVQTTNAGDVHWGVRTGGFADVDAARDFCDTIKARGFGCFVTGS